MTPPSTYTTKSGEELSRSTFISHYVAAFCAAWAARHYEDYCARDMHSQLERPPMEDALYLAAEAWTHLTVTIQP